eukprot:SAG22_NODE_635_length_8370_cov_33.081127_10_plen_184_part_00
MRTTVPHTASAQSPSHRLLRDAGSCARHLNSCPCSAWSWTTRTQVWPQHIVVKDTKEEYDVFAFKIASAGGTWNFRQRFSGLAKWHDEYIAAKHGKAAPKFPPKHALVGSKARSFCCASTVFLSKTVPFRAVLLPQAKKSDKFLEGRRLDLCRYFLQLLGVPGFLQSPELGFLLDKKKNAGEL